jgi:hypothetical protein
MANLGLISRGKQSIIVVYPFASQHPQKTLKRGVQDANTAREGIPGHITYDNDLSE